MSTTFTSVEKDFQKVVDNFDKSEKNETILLTRIMLWNDKDKTIQNKWNLIYHFFFLIQSSY